MKFCIKAFVNCSLTYVINPIPCRKKKKNPNHLMFNFHHYSGNCSPTECVCGNKQWVLTIKLYSTYKVKERSLIF